MFQITRKYIFIVLANEFFKSVRIPIDYEGWMNNKDIALCL